MINARAKLPVNYLLLFNFFIKKTMYKKPEKNRSDNAPYNQVLNTMGSFFITQKLYTAAPVARA